MKITVRQIKKIIEEELPAVLKSKKANGEPQADDRKKESDRARKRRLFGHVELDKLANGIVEDDDQEELEDEEEEDEIEELNKCHNSQGEFSSKNDCVTTSTYFVDKKRSGPKGLSDADDSGRGRTKTSKGRWRMKDNEPLWEHSFRRYVEEVDTPHDEKVQAPADTYDCAKKLQDQKVLIRKMKDMVEKAKKSGSKECPLSYQDAVRIINQLEKASKGKAYEN